MSNNQNNETANTVGLAAIVGVCIVAGFAFWAVFIALFLTLIAVCVQFKPIAYQGQTITAKDGRRFILLGLLGTMPFTILLVQVANWIDFAIKDDFVWAVFLLGYSLSAISINWFVDTFWSETEKPKKADAIDITPTSLPRPAEPRKPYQFADWDDEEVDRYK